MSYYQCLYCNKSYSTKYYCDRHTAFCSKFLHKSKMERRMETDTTNLMLTNSQVIQLLLDTTIKVEKQELEIQKMKKIIQSLTGKKKIHLEQWLNSPSGPVPTQTMREWIKKKIPVTIQHLEIVFKSDLLTAMFACLREALESLEIDGIPCCAFNQNQRQNHLYFYETRDESKPPKWMILSKEDLKSILNLLSHRFIQLYLPYSLNPSPPYDKTWSENHMIYSRKVMGKESDEDTRARCVKEFLFSHLKRNFNEIEIL